MPKSRNNNAIEAAKQTTRAKYEENRTQILNCLMNSSEGVTSEAIASRLGVSYSCAVRHLRLLEQEGIIEWEKDVINRNRKQWKMRG